MTKELTKINPGELFNVPEINQDLAADIEGMQITFDEIKIPAGGSIAWEVPGEDPAKEILGVIVDHHPMNVLWSETIGDMPLCVSYDGKVGVGDPGGNCQVCSNNMFGSAGRGKRCKNKRYLYLLRPNSLLPVKMILSAGSLKPFDDYVVRRLFARGLATWSVATKITLEKVQNADGQAYSRAVFDVAAVLEKDQAAKMAEYAKNIKAITRKQSSTPVLHEEEVPF